MTIGGDINDFGKNLLYYELYRSEQGGFEPGTDTFVSVVEPEDFVVGRYEDTGLMNHKKYYYRVCSVYKDGSRSDFSEEFNGITKEVASNDEVDMNFIKNTIVE